jgi:hypothetical protein
MAHLVKEEVISFSHGKRTFTVKNSIDGVFTFTFKNISMLHCAGMRIYFVSCGKEYVMPMRSSAEASDACASIARGMEEGE